MAPISAPIFRSRPSLGPEQGLGLRRVAGVDEAGRGPLAGPVVAAAVVLGDKAPEGVDDSKKLSRKQRARLYDAIMATAEVGIGIAEAAEIDAVNILEASLAAMARAVTALTHPPQACLIDGNRIPELAIPCHSLVRGDSLSVSVAAASIVAKVTRDRLMAALAQRHPGYGWERNAGYGTAEHLAALVRLGPTAQHRRSFAPVARLCRAAP
ncbi:MAG: ribonuclease HII [Pseudomonadota bacterium]